MPIFGINNYRKNNVQNDTLLIICKEVIGFYYSIISSLLCPERHVNSQIVNLYLICFMQ